MPQAARDLFAQLGVPLGALPTSDLVGADIVVHTAVADAATRFEPALAFRACGAAEARVSTEAAAVTEPNLPILRLRGVSVSFRAIRALVDVGFSVRRHEVCAIIGPNGAGKSSLLNVISGVYRPVQGEVTFEGRTERHIVSHQAARWGIARTFQNNAVFKGMSVLENVIAGGNLSFAATWIEQAFRIGRAARAEREARQRAEHVLGFLRLYRYRHQPVAALSYGLQKRVELGRALVANPKLLLLDEPLAGMNAAEKHEMSEHILAVNRDLGTTVLLIEHDMRVVMDISDHVVVLDHGRVIGDGTPAQVRSNPDVIRAYLGTKRAAA
jgi:branched-chain amino acid transport system ATP-binding protein